jgi:hypothetical protein
MRAVQYFTDTSNTYQTWMTMEFEGSTFESCFGYAKYTKLSF